MTMKPFRPPFLKKESPNQAQVNDHPQSPPAKRLRLNENVDSVEIKSLPRLVFRTPGVSSLPRKPLQSVLNTAVSSDSRQKDQQSETCYYNVLWRKYTTKKHKTWDGDGIVRVVDGFAYLQDVSGKDMGRTTCDEPLLPESKLSIAGKDVEIESILSREDYLESGTLSNSSNQSTAPATPLTAPIRPKLSLKKEVDIEKEGLKKKLNIAAPQSLASKSQWKNPMLVNNIMPKKEGKTPTPRHDPSTPGAIVMKRPQGVQDGKVIVDVVIDPILTKHLRDHQCEGVKFLYECVMGMRGFNGEGAILADEMGLGKTLQTIALIWTLLKQNPIYEEAPVIKKALIVCPVTLINNWKKEFRKWLGNERIGVFVADNTKIRLSDFTKSKSYNVMIIGYEKIRSVTEELKKGGGIDIVIADEGHRLKTATNKSAQAIKSLNTTRRVILSGTPIQNDLSEFFMMVDFVNPGLLETYKLFTKKFENPILKSRQPEANSEEVELGEARSAELASETTKFILRRTADILSKYLPPKTEYVLLCRPTPAQAEVYKHVLASPMFQSALGSSETQLQLITLLRKVCNGPKLLGDMVTNNSEKPINPLTASLIASIPRHLLHEQGSSTKIRVLDQLLHTLQNTTSEKIVLVSNFTTTLDQLQIFLTKNGIKYLRLDGTTPASKRQDLVETFNRAPASAITAFLLSAKAGGLGINLIGASRLVLFDVDWNPSIDAQAMARIHRDGQKRPCVIYRFLMAGGLDEKIWQRQVTKLGLASSVMDKKGGASSFTQEELKDLFTLDEKLACQTHELIGCKCGGKGLPDVSPVDEEAIEDPVDEDDELLDIPTLLKSSQVNMEDQERKIREAAEAAKTKGRGAKLLSLMNYSHVNTLDFKPGMDENMEALIHDDILLDVLKDETIDVSFVFAKTTG
ncbi:helicase [Xylographa opegraphella]|nr:helicase [Xylographa opegraphella]